MPKIGTILLDAGVAIAGLFMIYRGITAGIIKKNIKVSPYTTDVNTGKDAVRNGIFRIILGTAIFIWAVYFIIQIYTGRQEATW